MTRMDAPESEEHRIFSLISGFRASELIRAVVLLGLPDLVGDEPVGVEALAAATRAHGPSLGRAMRALASIGVFAETVDGCFVGTPLSARLRADWPGAWRAMAVALPDEGYAAWGDIVETLRSGEPAFPRVFGERFFDRLARDPARAADFNRWMAGGAAQDAAAIVAAYPFPERGTVVDVGGGDGTLISAVLRSRSELRGVVFDLSSALVDTPAALASQGVADRCRVVGGSFFEAVPRGDLYVLKRILHDWDDEAAVRILETCRAAMRPGARMLVIETLLPERVQHGFAAERVTMLDMHMLVLLGGRERSEREYAALLRRARLRHLRTVGTARPASLVEAEPS